MSHCDEGLRRIGRALAKYQQQQDGCNPSQLEELLEMSELAPWDFICPVSRDAVGQCSYTYRGSDLTIGADPKMIIAYDKLPLHRNRRNILFPGGKVKRPTESQFEKAIARDNELRLQHGLPEKPV